VIYAVTNGFLDDLEVDQVRAWESGFLEFMRSSNAAIAEEIRTKKALSDELTGKLKAAVEQYKALRK
jgi:F-type H+-transporting ATPase subunit alpha